MSIPLDLRTDWHTHTDRTDGGDSLTDMIDAARAQGLHRLHLTDHVRADTTWVPDYVAEIRSQRGRTEVELVCGVEAKILDVRGTLDLPADLSGVEIVVIADHQFPTRSGPVTPQEMGQRIARGQMRADDAIDDLLLATSRAVLRHERVVVGHLLSVLPKAGIDPSQVTSQQVAPLAAACREAGAVVEVNEKWRTPSLDLIRILCSLGVDLVPSSDAHDTEAVGRWDHVQQAARQIDP